MSTPETKCPLCEHYRNRIIDELALEVKLLDELTKTVQTLSEILLDPETPPPIRSKIGALLNSVSITKQNG